jgi:hypothetical protein
VTSTIRDHVIGPSLGAHLSAGKALYLQSYCFRGGFFLEFAASSPRE